MPRRIPVQTIFEAHSDGCAAIAMSPDAKYIATISSTLPQVHNNFYYIDTSVLLGNIPLVKFINATSGTRVVYFHNVTREFINDIISAISLYYFIDVFWSI